MFRIIENEETHLIDLHNEDGYLCSFGESPEDVYELRKACDVYMHG